MKYEDIITIRGNIKSCDVDSYKILEKLILIRMNEIRKFWEMSESAYSVLYRGDGQDPMWQAATTPGETPVQEVNETRKLGEMSESASSVLPQGEGHVPAREIVTTPGETPVQEVNEIKKIGEISESASSVLPQGEGHDPELKVVTTTEKTPVHKRYNMTKMDFYLACMASSIKLMHFSNQGEEFDEDFEATINEHVANYHEFKRLIVLRKEIKNRVEHFRTTEVLEISLEDTESPIPSSLPLEKLITKLFGFYTEECIKGDSSSKEKRRMISHAVRTLIIKGFSKKDGTPYTVGTVEKTIRKVRRLEKIKKINEKTRK